jgi:hypothetical protein
VTILVTTPCIKMQLRNGKTISSDKKDFLVGAIQSRLKLIGQVPEDETPIRIAGAHEIFSIILNNIDYIMTDEFSPEQKFVQTVYNKTFEMADQAYDSSDLYITEKKPRNIRTIRRQVEEFCSLLSQVQTAIDDRRRASIKPSSWCEDPGCSCYTYL